MELFGKNKKADAVPSTSTGGSGKFGSDLDYASAEAYNLLRTNLLFTIPAKEGGRIIGVTSSVPTEGKTFSTINMSYSLAEAGYKVILVDCDMRRSSVAKSLKKPVSPGLSNLLIDSDKAVIHKGVLHPNLSGVRAGDIPPNPSELLGTERMHDLLEYFSKEYDYVIVDLPPVTAVSDPLVVSKYLDGIVIVVRHNFTRKSELMEAIRQLRFTGVHILGFIYNGCTTNSAGYSKKYYRRMQYYGHYSNDTATDAKAKVKVQK